MLANRGKNIGNRNIFHRGAGVVFLIFAVVILCAIVLTSFAACNKNEGGNSSEAPEVNVPSEDEDPPEGDEEEDSKLKKFENIIYEDAFVTYDGRAHVIEAQGLPFGATVKYSLTDCVDVGEYDITATFKLVGYETLSLTATLTILPAKVDVAFEDASFVWDGAPHSIYVKGDLPSDAIVLYDGNDCVEVGEHIVVAHIILSRNYVPIEDLTAKLTIIERQYTISFVHWDGEVETRKVYRGGSLSQNDIPANKDKEGYYEMIWDPDDLARLDDVRSDVTVNEIEGGIKYYTVVFQPGGGIMPHMSQLERGDDGLWTLKYTARDDIRLPQPLATDDIGTFVGWYDEEGRLVTRLPDEAGLRDMFLTAKWENESAPARLAERGEHMAQQIAHSAAFCRVKH